MARLFAHKSFSVELLRSICVSQLRWPASGEAAQDAGLGCNREYADFRNVSWREAREVLAKERTLIERIVSSSSPDKTYEEIEEECSEDGPPLLGLDIGVASSVVTL